MHGRTRRPRSPDRPDGIVSWGWMAPLYHSPLHRSFSARSPYRFDVFPVHDAPSKSPSALQTMLLVCTLATGWSAIHPADYATWFFELFVGAAGIAALVCIRNRFRFSPLVYGIVALHFVVLAIGAKYTYADEPIFNWLKDSLGLSRNYFDRVGHFLQGVTPALITREALLRSTGLQRGAFTGFLSACVALAFSAFYELLEWVWVLMFYPDNGPEWLGMQGDPWDTQGDMAAALCGALVVVLLLSRWHDRSMQRM